MHFKLDPAGVSFMNLQDVKFLHKKQVRPQKTYIVFFRKTAAICGVYLVYCIISRKVKTLIWKTAKKSKMFNLF